MSDAPPPVPATPAFGEAAAVFARIGLLSFGGPAGQIGLMHRELVERRRWIDEARFLEALSVCLLLPGPEAMQLATWCGWRLHGIAGGLLAGVLFVMPGALLIAALAIAYVVWGQVPAVAGVFVGVQAAVLAIVANALLNLARRALTRAADRVLALSAWVALFAFAIPFPAIVIAAALLGAFGRPWRQRVSAAPSAAPATAPATAASIAVSTAPDGVPTPAQTPVPAATSRPGVWRGSAATALVLTCAWWLPMALLAVALGGDHVLVEIGLLCSQLAVVTFGGAYAVLTYLAQDVVTLRGWLTAGEMMDALGLAETTPGPLILVIQFVSMLAAWREASPPGVVAGLAGWVVSLWTTFVPCFLWVLAGAPHIESVSQRPRLRAALDAITAAVVGVMANLALWFALHLCFATLGTLAFGPAQFPWPDWVSVRPLPTLLAVAGFVALRRGLPVPALILAGAVLAWALG